MLHLVAAQGPTVLLFGTDDGRGFIWEEGSVWAPRPILAILARGYWRAPDGIDEGSALALLAEAERVGPEWSPESEAILEGAQ